MSAPLSDAEELLCFGAVKSGRTIPPRYRVDVRVQAEAEAEAAKGKAPREIALVFLHDAQNRFGCGRSVGQALDDLVGSR